MLDEEQQELQGHIGTLRSTSHRDREALYSEMPIFNKPKHEDILVRIDITPTGPDSETGHENGSQTDHSEAYQSTKRSNKQVMEAPTDTNDPMGVRSANEETNHRSGQVLDWHRKIVQHPSEAIPFGSEETLGGVNRNSKTTSQLYIGKAELEGICHFVCVSLRDGDRMIVEGAPLYYQKRLTTWCRLLCGSIRDFGWLRVTLENSRFESDHYEAALKTENYKLLSLCRPGCSCGSINSMYAACLNPEKGGEAYLGRIREGETNALFIKGKEVVKDTTFYVLLVKEGVQARGNSL
ncbi:hypothetical protein FS837_001572 [Tulasnella sp. UAMH 9824]|nr:hypothetical protein FS837_001572 [Tulasnella sp. UAMH 9824]